MATPPRQMGLFVFVLLASWGRDYCCQASRLLRVARLAQGRQTPYRQRLGNHQDVQYHGDIEIGGQVIQAVFDTGSFDTLVSSTKCAECQYPPYNATISKTFVATESMVRHTYGSGPVQSVRGFERIRVGPLEAKNQTFYEIIEHNMSVLNNSASFDAIAGIGPSDPNSTAPSLLESFNVSEFSVCLERRRGAPGWLTWGSELSAEQKANETVELSVVGRRHWAVGMSDMLPAMDLDETRRDAAQRLLCGNNCAAVLDSGTSLIAMPSHSLQAMQYLLPPLNRNCSNFGDLPDLEFTLSGHKLRLPPNAYTLRVGGSHAEKQKVAKLLGLDPTKDEDFEQEQSAIDSGMCMIAFIPMDVHTEFGPLWILGMPFFRYFHTTFLPATNVPDRRVWLSSASDDCRPEPLHITELNQTEDPRYDGVGVYPKTVVAQLRGRGLRHASRREATARTLTRSDDDTLPMLVDAASIRLPSFSGPL